MNLSLILFSTSVLGFVLNRKNIILMLISIEIMLLAITFLILTISLSFDDILGQIHAIYIIAIAGAALVIGLDLFLVKIICLFAIFLFLRASIVSGFFGINITKSLYIYSKTIDNYILYKLESMNKLNSMSIKFILINMYSNKYKVLLTIFLSFLSRLLFYWFSLPSSEHNSFILILLLVLCIYMVLYATLFGFINKVTLIQGLVIKLLVTICFLFIVLIFPCLFINECNMIYITILCPYDFIGLVFISSDNGANIFPYYNLSGSAPGCDGGPSPPGNNSNNPIILGHNPASNDNNSTNNDSNSNNNGNSEKSNSSNKSSNSSSRSNSSGSEDSFFEENFTFPSVPGINTSSYKSLADSIVNMCLTHPQFNTKESMTLGQLGIRRPTKESDMLIRTLKITVDSDKDWDKFAIWSYGKRTSSKPGYDLLRKVSKFDKATIN